MDAKRPLAELNSLGYDDDEEMCMKALSTVPGFRDGKNNRNQVWSWGEGIMEEQDFHVELTWLAY